MVNAMVAKKYQRPISPDPLAWGILFIAIFGGFFILVLAIVIIAIYIYTKGYDILVLAFLCFTLLGLSAMYALSHFAQPLSIYFYNKRGP